MSQTTPTLAEAIEAALQRLAQDLRVCLPAQIVSVHGGQLVDVQPLLQVQAVAESAPRQMPILPNVPVSMPRGQAWGIRYPIAVGDCGWVIFADRDMDAWLSGNGGVATPGTPRTHSLNDAIFVPGLGPDAAQAADTGGDVVVQAGLATLRVQPAGTFTLGNGSAELTDQVSKLAADVFALRAYLTTATSPSGAVTSTSGPLAAMQASTDAAKSLKGR